MKKFGNVKYFSYIYYVNKLKYEVKGYTKNS